MGGRKDQNPLRKSQEMGEGCAFQSEWILATFINKSVVCDVVEKSVSWQCCDLENNVRIHLFTGVDSSEFC